MPEEAVDGMPAEVAETQDKGVALAVTEFTVEKVLEELRALPLTERKNSFGHQKSALVSMASRIYKTAAIFF